MSDPVQQVDGTAEPTPAKPKWRGRLGLLLRVTVTVVGLAVIAGWMQWTDAVVMSESAVIDGFTLEAGQRLAVEQWNEAQVQVRISEQEVLVTTQEAMIDAGGVFRAGILRTFGEANLLLILAAIALTALRLLIQTGRWWLIVDIHDLRSDFWRLHRLTHVGLFYSNFLPGMTGGDVVRGVLLGRETKQWKRAASTVVIDRGIGLAMLLLLACGGFLIALRSEYGGWLTWATAGALGAVALASMGFFSRRVRAALGLQALWDRVPETGHFAAVKGLARAFRERPVALMGVVAQSAAIHVIMIFATAISGWALGMGGEAWDLFVKLPIIIFAGAMPISIMGFGVMEPTAIALLANPPVVTVNHLVGMLLLLRAYQMLFSFLGAGFVLTGERAVDGDVATGSSQSDEQSSTAEHVAAA